LVEAKETAVEKSGEVAKGTSKINKPGSELQRGDSLKS
jgi:hypothetical protein